MIERIRELLGTAPFEPFIIHTRGGKQYRIPTIIAVEPEGLAMA